MNSRFFTPWIGSLYGGRGSVLAKRVMVLGASHLANSDVPTCGRPFRGPKTCHSRSKFDIMVKF